MLQTLHASKEVLDDLARTLIPLGIQQIMAQKPFTRRFYPRPVPQHCWAIVLERDGLVEYHEFLSSRPQVDWSQVLRNLGLDAKCEIAFEYKGRV